MLNIRRFLLLSCCICVLTSCSNSNDSSLLEESLLVLTKNSNLENRIVFVIPLDGDVGCMTKSLEFAKEASDSECEFIITDDKFFKIKMFAGKLIGQRNIFIDTTVVFKSKLRMSNVPKIFYCQNGKLENVVKLTPENVDNELIKLRKKAKKE